MFPAVVFYSGVYGTGPTRLSETEAFELLSGGFEWRREGRRVVCTLGDGTVVVLLQSRRYRWFRRPEGVVSGAG